MAGNSYGTIARANVLLVPKFDKLGKSIEDATKSVNTGSAGSSIGEKLTASIKLKLGGIGSGVSDALGKVDAGSAGANIGSKLSKGVSANVGDIGKSVSDSIGKVDATSTGTSIGGKLTSAIGARTTSIGQSISAALSKVDASSHGQGIGSSLVIGIKSKLGGIGSSIKDALSAVGSSGLGEKVSSIASGVGSAAMSAVKGVALGATAAAAAAGTAVVAIGKEALSSYADFEQLSGGIEKIFDQADVTQIMKDAQGAYKDLGMSANQYLESMNQVGATFAQTMGDQKGYDTARKGMLAISDYASGTGRSIDELNEKYKLITRSTSGYQSIADQFSGLLPQTSEGFLEQAKQAGYLSEQYEKLTDVPVAEYQEAVTQMLEKGVADMGLSGNTLAESMTTITGSIDAAKAAWSNWLTELGKDNADITSRTQELIDSVFGTGEGNPGVVGNIVPRVLQIGEQIISNLPDIMSRIGAVIHDNIVPKLDEITGGKASEFIAAFENIGKKVGEVFEKLKPHIDNLIEQLGPILTDVILPALKMAFDGIGNVISVVGDAIGVVVDIISGFLSVVNAIVDAISAAAEAAANFLGISGSGGGWEDSGGGFSSSGGGDFGSSTHIVGGGGGHYTFAEGGRVTGPTYALIGEAGYDEYVVPNTRSGMQPLADNLADELGRRDDELIASIYSVRDEIKGMGVYLDGSKLVGGIQSRMSRALVMR